MQSIKSRLKVIGAGFLLGAVLSGCAATSGASEMGWSPKDAFEVWASVLAGPFAGLWATATWGWVDAVGWAAGCMVGMAAHPFRPGWLTRLVSGVSVALWLLLGFALTYDGV